MRHVCVGCASVVVLGYSYRLPQRDPNDANGDFAAPPAAFLSAEGRITAAEGSVHG